MLLYSHPCFTVQAEDKYRANDWGKCPISNINRSPIRLVHLDHLLLNMSDILKNLTFSYVLYLRERSIWYVMSANILESRCNPWISSLKSAFCQWHFIIDCDSDGETQTKGRRGIERSAFIDGFKILHKLTCSHSGRVWFWSLSHLFKLYIMVSVLYVSVCLPWTSMQNWCCSPSAFTDSFWCEFPPQYQTKFWPTYRRLTAEFIFRYKKKLKKRKKNLPKIFSVFLWSLIFQFVVLSDESYDVWENMNWILARHGGKAENTSAPSDAIQHSLQGLWEFITFLGGMSQKQRKREDLRLTILVSFTGTAHCHKALWVS